MIQFECNEKNMGTGTVTVLAKVYTEKVRKYRDSNHRSFGVYFNDELVRDFIVAEYEIVNIAFMRDMVLRGKPCSFVVNDLSYLLFVSPASLRVVITESGFGVRSECYDTKIKFSEIRGKEMWLCLDNEVDIFKENNLVVAMADELLYNAIESDDITHARCLSEVNTEGLFVKYFR